MWAEQRDSVPFILVAVLSHPLSAKGARQIKKSGENCKGCIFKGWTAYQGWILEVFPNQAQTNLFKVIRDDLLMRNINLSCYEEILHLRELASDRSKWKKFFSEV